MSKKNRKPASSRTAQLRFEDNNLARNLFGPQETHLKALEDILGVTISVRGGEVNIRGDKDTIEVTERILDEFYTLLKKGYPVFSHDIERAAKMLKEDGSASLGDLFLDSVVIPAKKKVIYPQTIGQKQYLEKMMQHDLVFGVGPAGTGKTYLAMAMAVTSFLKGEVDRIILTRPAIEAGEKLGFLPGNLVEKVNPYLRPLYDAMHDMLEFEKTQKMLERGEIEIAPLAFMRGRTLSNAFVILDEAQNCTREQMKMFLTRLGYRSKGVITGDVTQIDLPAEKKSGLVHALKVLQNVPGICIHYFNPRDVVRHPLVQKIIEAYDRDSSLTA